MYVEEFKAKIGKIDSECSIYEVVCGDCITYIDTQSMTGIVSGWMDGKEHQEFYKLEHAEAAIRLHRDKKPLHNPRILPPVTEYLTHDDRYILRYRAENDHVKIHSVNGFRIPSDKCAFACKKCGAIYTSRALYDRSFFPTSDPKCKVEVHHFYEEKDVLRKEYNIEKICICPDLDEYRQLEEEELHRNWWEANPDKVSKCHLCGFNYPEGQGWKDLAKGWHNPTWTGDARYEEKLVCENCYCTSQEYERRCGSKNRRRYLLAKKMMVKIEDGYHDLYQVDRGDVAEYMISKYILPKEDAFDFTPEDEEKLARVLENDWDNLDDYSKMMYHVLKRTIGFLDGRRSCPPTEEFIQWLKEFLDRDPRLT